jgi:nucleotide-binding universal stress UspA family protein
MVKNILIAIDGSAFGKAATAYAITIAGKLDAGLTGLHVIDIRLLQGPVLTDISGALGLPSCQPCLPDIEQGLEARAEAILAEFRRQCEAAGIHSETLKITGVIDETIIEVGRKCCDWVLLARRGEHVHLGGGAILGSTAEAVVRRSGKPVLVTPERYREIESLALAYDGSPPARHALQLAAGLSAAAAWPLTVVVVSNDQAQGAQIAAEAEDALASFEADSTVILLPGREDKALLSFIREGAVELLVMGAYGHNRLRELLVGSTTSALIRKSPIPVLLTR